MYNWPFTGGAEVVDDRDRASANFNHLHAYWEQVVCTVDAAVD
jgi:hypothetical protein